MWKSLCLVAAGAVGASLLLLRRRPPPTMDAVLMFDDEVGTCSSNERCDLESCAVHKVNLVARVIRSAKVTLDACVYLVSNYELSNAILDAHRAGVAVRVIVDHDVAYNNGSQTFKMISQGIPVRSKQSKFLMHHKFCVVDGGQPGQILITGSLNWTKQGCYGNWESLIVTTHRPLINGFRAEFERLWRAFPPLLPDS